MNTAVYSHRNGIEVLPNSMLEDILQIFPAINIPTSNLQAPRIRNCIEEGLYRKSWSDKILLDKKSKISITSMKDHIGLCLQTGNVSRTYADLLKLQALFVRGSIQCGIIIVPTGDAARKMAQNMASYERLVYEVSTVFPQVITMPLVVIGFYE